MFYHGCIVEIPEDHNVLSGDYVLLEEFEGANLFYLEPTKDDQKPARVSRKWLERVGAKAKEVDI